MKERTITMKTAACTLTYAAYDATLENGQPVTLLGDFGDWAVYAGRLGDNVAMTKSLVAAKLGTITRHATFGSWYASRVRQSGKTEYAFLDKALAHLTR